jgi:hypothetical protein
LAQIDISTPSAKTLRYATFECDTPDGNTWVEGLRPDPIRESVSLFSPGVNPSDASIYLAKRRDPNQTGSADTNQAMLSSNLFANAIVTLYLWVVMPAELAQLSASDLFQVYKGRVSRVVDIDHEGMRLLLLQDMSWNRQVPPTVVDKISYPDSPDVSQGAPIPIVYGDHSAPKMRAPWTTAYGNRSKQEDSGAGLGVVPLVLVDAGVGAANVKVVAASHLCADILDRANGLSAFIVGESLLNPIDTAGITENLGSSESYLSIADEGTIAYAAIIPIDVRSTGGENTAGEPRRAMDPFDETSFSTLDQGAGKTQLQLILPNAGALGRIESVQYYVAWSGDAGNGNNLRIRSRTPGVGFGTTTANWLATGTTPAVQTGTWAAADYDANAWGFGDNGTALFDVRVDFTGGATNKAKIYWVVLVVKYRPQRSLVTPGKRVVSGMKVSRGAPFNPPIGGRPIPSRTFTDIAATYALEGQFYGNVKGYKDDGSGTFTGTASALIERPADIIRHFLVTYGGVSGGSIETGAGASGSFVDLRNTLRNAQPSDFKLAVHISERMSVQQAVQKMAEQAGVAVYLDRFTNKWLAFPWKPGALIDYDLAVPWDLMSQFVSEQTTVVDVRHALRVKYGFDYFKNRTLYEAFVNSAGSSQGFTQPTVRDQKLVITTGVNDKFDWKVGVTTYAATLAAGTYAAIDLASEWRTKIRAQEGNNSAATGFGFSIKAGFNNLFDFVVGGTPYQATLTAADYAVETFAIEIARAMNAVPGHGRVFSCTYDHATNKVTVSATGGTFTFPSLNTAAGIATSALPAAGFVYASGSAPAAAASITAPIARYGDRFFLCDGDVTNTSTYLWLTGANQATNCAEVVGYARADSVGITIGITHADYQRGSRETSAATFESYYDPREELQITAEWIRDETSAVQLRNRRFDVGGTQRTVCKFATHYMPDVRRMQVIPIDSTVDAKASFSKYGSDGLWAGKSMLVLDVTQNLGPSDWSTEIMAINID